MLSLKKKTIQQRLKNLIKNPKKSLGSILKNTKYETSEELISLKSKKIKKLRSHPSIRSNQREIEMKLKADQDIHNHVPSFGNLKTPLKMEIESSSTSNFMNIFTNEHESAEISYHHQNNEIKAIKVDSSKKKWKYPKPKLKFPIPDTKILKKLISQQKLRVSSGSSRKKPPDESTKEKRKECSIFKASKVSQLKLKVKTIKRIINNYENNVTSICKKFGNKRDENGKTFKICKEKWKKLKIVHRRNFVYLSHNYKNVSGIPADIVAVCLLLFSAIKVGISASLFVKAARNLAKTRINNVKQLRENACYQVIKTVLKRD